jgi:hypothetical protein
MLAKIVGNYIRVGTGNEKVVTSVLENKGFPPCSLVGFDFLQNIDF